MIGAGRSFDSASKGNDNARPLHQEQNAGGAQKGDGQNASLARPSSGRKRKASPDGKQSETKVSPACRAHRSLNDWNQLPDFGIETPAGPRVPTNIGYLPMISSYSAPPVVATTREHGNDGTLTMPASGMARDSSSVRPQVGLRDNISDPALATASVSDVANLMHMPFSGRSSNLGTQRDSDPSYGGAFQPTLAQSAFPVPHLLDFSGFANQHDTPTIQSGVGQMGDSLTTSQSNTTNLLNLSLQGNVPRLDTLMVPPFVAGLPNHTSSSQRHHFPPTNLPSSNQGLASPMMNHPTITSSPSDNIESVVATSSSANFYRPSLENLTTISPALAAAAQQHGAQQQQPKHNEPSGRTAILSMESDQYCLSKFQSLSRKQIQLFEAMPGDIAVGARGRNNPITLGQGMLHFCSFLVWGLIRSCPLDRTVH